MIELAFEQSAAGALKMAKSTKQGERMQGAVAVIGGSAKERARLLREARKPHCWTGVTMEGSSKDVAVLGLYFDIGNISGADGSVQNRKSVLDTLFGDYPGAADAMWSASQQGLNRLEEAKATHEPLRIWLCEASPGELCGLHFVCRLMEGAEAPLSVVRIPARAVKEDCVIEYRGSGEIDAELLGAMALKQQLLSPVERMAYARRWSELTHENAPLRAVVNSRLMGVPDDFYDFALRAHMTKGQFNMAQLIGKTLGDLPGVGDRWLFLRVQAMLASGELVEVSAATEDHPYSAVLKRRR